MSQENVDALRWLYQEWAKGDLWALRKIADPNIEWEWTAGMASVSGEPRIYRGLDEIGATTLEWIEAWDFYWMTAEDFVEAGDEIVVPMQLHARTPGSDSVLEQRMAAVWTLRNGKALRVRYYDDKAEALEAVGLSEQDAHADS
jgi:ketosteroid isomerase-like protein